jgi:hypothetical protein
MLIRESSLISRAWRVSLPVMLASALLQPVAASAQSVESWEQQLQNTVSSLGVVTKQLSMTSSNSSNVKLQGQQALQSTMADASTANQVRETVDAFGPNGQLIDGCYQVGMAGQASQTSAQTAAHANAATARLYKLSNTGTASSGGVAGALGGTTQVTQFPYSASIAQRVNRHTSHYCTVSEAQLGYCTLNANGMQGGDADFSLHLQPGKTYGWDQTEASTDFIKTVAPMRPTPNSEPCASTACVAAQQERSRQEAMMSMARYSLIRFTESHETQKTGDAEQAQ